MKPKYTTFTSMLQKYVSASMLLVIATILALIVANLPFTKESYAQFFGQTISLSIGDFNLFAHGHHNMTLADFINDFLMAIFFLSVGLEIKREVLCGELSNMKKAMLPVIGACGGMIVPVIVFFLVCSGNEVAERGMAIPMATDIAFSLGCLSVFSKRVPLGLKVFLAALAVADDLGGIIVIAVKYTEHLSSVFLAGAILVTILLVMGNKMGVRKQSFYLTFGVVLWYCTMNSGIHATIAGVVLAFCVPANLDKGTKFYIEQIRRIVGLYPVIEVTHEDRNKPYVMSEEDIQTLRGIEVCSDHLISPLQDLEDNLHTVVNYFIIPVFAFANAGVCFKGMSLMNLFSGVGLGVFLGLFIGKFLGVLSFSWVSIKMGIVQMPAHANWKSFASVCMLCGIGFTVSMFIAQLSYGSVAGAETMLNDAKLGILCGTIISALVGCLMLRFTLPSEKQMEEWNK